MKKIFAVLFALALVISVSVNGQETSQDKPSYIKGGYYMKLGPVFPVGAFAQQQSEPVLNGNELLYYQPARIGAALDMGVLIYIGPSFANKVLRAGIDATFLSGSFNSTKTASGASDWKHFYYFVGQKFGPVITINPVDRLMIDLSWKLNADVSVYYGEWEDFESDQYNDIGISFLRQEVSLSLRYRALVVSVMYNFGNTSYNNFSSSRDKQTIETNTIRIMFGFKV